MGSRNSAGMFFDVYLYKTTKFIKFYKFRNLP